MASEYWPSGAPKWLGNKIDYASGNGLIPQPTQANSSNPLIPQATTIRMPEMKPYEFEKPKQSYSSDGDTFIPNQAYLQEIYRKNQENTYNQWKDAYGIWADQQAKKYQYTGLVPELYPGDPSATIRQAQQNYNIAKTNSDSNAMQQAHDTAEQARQAAGWGSGGASGDLTAGLMTRAGLPSYAMLNDNRDFTENQRQFNVGAAADLSKAFGYGIQPKQGGYELFSQIEGRPTADYQYQQGSLANQRYGMNLDYDASMYNTDMDYNAAMTGLDAKNTASLEKASPKASYDAATAAATGYKTGNDYYSDVLRHQSELVQRMGADNYQKLLKYAEKLRDDGFTGSGFRSGDSSPIRKMLEAPTVNPNSPTVSRSGIDRNIVNAVNQVAAKYGIDGALILAIGQHETGWGKLGDGRKGMYLGYGSYDNGSDYKYAGLSNQLEGVAKKLKAWGMTPGNVSLERLRLGNSGKLPTGIYATDQNWPNAVWKYYLQYKG